MQVLKKYKVTAQERIQAIEGILSFLEKEEIVSFAYIYGSFYSEDGFNDIDVAVYLNEAAVKGIDMFDFQLDLGVRLERDLNTYPIDCRALNIAPLTKLSTKLRGHTKQKTKKLRGHSFPVIFS